MTKHMLLLTSIFTALAHGMETNSLLEITKKCFNITYYGTKINVTKESLFEISDKATMTVVGKHQQNMLHDHFDENYENIGTVYFPDPMICQRDKEYDSDSDDDTYKPDIPSNEQSTLKTVHDSLIAKIIEPCPKQIIMPSKEKIYLYYVNKKEINKYSTFDGEAAIERASKDLIQCYNNVLTFPIEYGTLSNHINDHTNNHINDHTKPTVALPPLGADVGFPRDKAAPIAITTVLEWIKNNPNAYETIYFYVKKRSDFARYKLLLLEQCKILHNICLLYFARKHNDSIVSLLPQEIVHYVTQLI